MATLLGICGSTRRGSVNRQLLQALARSVPQRATMTIYDGVGALPIFDDDAHEPAAVVELKRQVAAADGVVIAVPDYNDSIPGGLKNAIDWLSRPHSASPLAGKLVAVIGATTGASAPSRARAHLREVLESTDSVFVSAPELTLGGADARFLADGAPASVTVAARVTALIEALLGLAARRTGVALLVALALVAGAPIAAATPQLASARGAPTVDGALDDEIWQRAAFAETFHQREPVYGASPTRPMRVAVAFGADRVVVAARMWGVATDDALTARDDVEHVETFTVAFDPEAGRRTAYAFAVTARGVRGDWRTINDDEDSRDASWDPVWSASARMLDDGWAVELAIPYSQLPLPREPRSRWGINFERRIPSTREVVAWASVPRDVAGSASTFGALEDVPVIQPGIALQLAPYVSVRASLRDDGSARSSEFSVGLDVRAQPWSGLVVDATFNPDFAQVESDPAAVNLTGFELELEDKRPFFVAANQRLAHDDVSYFYSRRIGAVPTQLPANIVTPPSEVRILGALAAHGELHRDLRLSVLGAITDEASAEGTIDDATRAVVVAPLTAWAVGRLERRAGPSTFGAYGTYVERALADTNLGDLLARRAYVGAFDARLRSANGAWELSSWLGVSAVHGTTAAITRLQQAPAHYFQRPDQPRLDRDATELWGWSGHLYGTKRSGTYRGSLGASVESPGWDVNDLGVIREADGIEVAGEAERVITTPSRLLYEWRLAASADQEWTFGGERRPAGIRASIGATFANQWSARLAVGAGTPGSSPGLTRGGPALRVGWSSASALEVASPEAARVVARARVDGYASPTLNHGLVMTAGLGVRPTRALHVELGARLMTLATRRQYLTTIPDAAAAATYGHRYMFARLRRREASAELRVTWSLTTDLSLALWMQPFAATGSYDEIGELRAPRSPHLRGYDQVARADEERVITDRDRMFAIDEPDYTRMSVRSTVVLRWELRPGSTLYIAWRQDREAEQLEARTLGAAAREAWTRPGIHTLACKLTYWFD
jgi:NAD(P)H-dependent FMN reductase